MLKSKNEVKIVVPDSDISVLYRIADKTLYPLDGPMNQSDFNNVLENEYILRKNKKLAWTIPIILPISSQLSSKLRVGTKVKLVSKDDLNIGYINISQIYFFDKKKYLKSIYGTTRSDHPGTRQIIEDSRTHLVAGKIKVKKQVFDSAYAQFMLNKKECLDLFKKKGWDRVIAFQTRNPLHKAHEFLIVKAAEKIIQENINKTTDSNKQKGKNQDKKENTIKIGVVLNPMVGATKADDVPPKVRMRTYRVLIDNKLLGKEFLDSKLWQDQKNYLLDNMALIGIDMKMFFAGPKEAVMHAIYRQNLGFTDIIIGRRHADAPCEDKTHLYDEFAAHKIFENLKGKLKINVIKMGQAGFCKETNEICMLDEIHKKNLTQISISGTELRKKLANNEKIDEQIIRKEIAEILKDTYKKNIGGIRNQIKSTNIVWQNSTVTKSQRIIKNKHKGTVVWLTGLSASGKSTIANNLSIQLFNSGVQSYVLDGDNIRHGLNKDLGFEEKDRVENIRRISEVAKLFVDAGFICIAAFISPYKEDRKMARSIFEKNEFIEVFIDTPLKICENRDPKGLYKKARAGQIKNFTGISAPYEKPINPEISIDTKKPISVCIKQIQDYLQRKKIIS